ncbi:tetratricopeptide repeat protein [Acetobacter conturbans]|uniref:Tetratricopeptide repeat-like domain-containing protein n=1 Tax=Acetobacter conturbans TaxID=1737472 RepID=A0ABX0JYR9_9PROT|nr:hypothetical protein [Acetobacter conturbans]
MNRIFPAVISGVILLTLPQAHAAPLPDPATIAGQTQRAALVAQLAKAKNETEAAQIRDQLEGLRTKAIRPATLLLVRRAMRELGEEKPGDAIEDFGAALSLQADVAVLWRLRAQARLAGGDTSGAISDLGVALQHDGEDAISWQTLATTEDAAGDDQAALKAWQRVMELDPQLPGAGKMFEKLRLKAFGRPT